MKEMNVRVSGVKNVVIVRSVSEGDESESEWSEESCDSEECE